MSKYRIEDDLYNYVNGEWISKAKIPSDQPVTGGFMNLAINVEKIMLKELKLLTKRASKDELLSRAVCLYNKALDEDNRQRGKDYLLEKLAFFDSIKSIDDLNNALYYLYDNSYILPFEIGVAVDMMDATKHALVITGPQTILPDTTMYNTPNEVQLLGIYSQMVLEVFGKLGIKDDDKLVEKALAFDKKISKIVKSSEEWADYIKTYNPYDFTKVCELLGLDFKHLVVSRFGKCPEKVIVYDPKFLENFKELMNDSLDLYIAWAKIKTVINQVQYLSEELRNLSGIYSRALNGVKEMSNINRFAYSLTNRYYSEVLGVYYGKKYFGEEAKKDATNIVKNLVETYKRRLSENTWLSKDTIKKAIIKLDKMEIKIGYPDFVNEKYYHLVFSENKSLIEIVDELNKITNAYHDSKLYEVVDRSIWVMSGNTVNACYNPSSNDITFPAAILQKPFYSLDQAVEENYGGIGCVIGHEISHAFDNNGAQMDELGNIKNWWTEADYANFNNKTEDMVIQFDGLELAGAKVNGRLSVSENIADNGGVASSIETLKRVKPNSNFQLFFMNYARIWCQKAREEFTRLLLTIDVHGPAYYRANMQVKNFPEFYEAFNIKETDKMYLEPSKRIIIW